MVDKIVRFIPIGTIVIIVCGYLKLFSYYSLFGLDVSPFLGLSDLFNLFLSDSISIALALASPIYFLINQENISKEIAEEVIRIDERKKMYAMFIGDMQKMRVFAGIPLYEMPTQSAGSRKNYNYYWFGGFVLCVLAFIILLFQDQTRNISSWYILLASTTPLFFLSMLNGTKLDPGKYYNFLLFLFGLILLIFARINYDYYNVMHPKTYSMIETLDGSVYICNDRIKILGFTEHYNFLHNTQTGENTIIRNDNLKKITSILKSDLSK